MRRGRMPGMKAPTWTLSELLTGVGFISIGWALASFVYSHPGTTYLDAIAFWCSASAFGTGVGTFFQQKLLGAIAGVFSVAVLFVLFILLTVAITCFW